MVYNRPAMKNPPEIHVHGTSLFIVLPWELQGVTLRHSVESVLMQNILGYDCHERTVAGHLLKMHCSLTG